MVPRRLVRFPSVGPLDSLRWKVPASPAGLSAPLGFSEMDFESLSDRFRVVFRPISSRFPFDFETFSALLVGKFPAFRLVNFVVVGLLRGFSNRCFAVGFPWDCPLSSQCLSQSVDNSVALERDNLDLVLKFRFIIDNRENDRLRIRSDSGIISSSRGKPSQRCPQWTSCTNQFESWQTQAAMSVEGIVYRVRQVTQIPQSDISST